MNCPSCRHKNPEGARYCVRCRMSFSAVHLYVTRLRDHLYWILRRASAGFSAGFVAFFFVSMISRILSQGSSSLFIFSLCGFMGGAFLGCVDGMVEESSPKTVRGAVIGGIGGALGGVIFAYLHGALSHGYLVWAFFAYWAVPGAFIGMVSSQWEKQRNKLIYGIVGGFVGGGAGGVFGARVSATFQGMEAPTWLMERLAESLTGAFIGLTLWFFIALAERFFIFRRRLVVSRDHKNCDACQAKNPPSSWYCGSCGAVLQESVPPEKLDLPPHKTLNRLQEMFRFLSRLSAATGFIAGFVALFIFLPENPATIIVVWVVIALISYTLQVIFSSLSESLRIFIR